MTGLEWVLLGSLVVVIGLLAIATAGNADLAAENRDLRARLHPSTRGQR